MDEYNQNTLYETNLELLYEQKQKRGKYKRKKTDPVSHYLEEYGRRFSYFSMAITMYHDQGN